MAIETIRNGNNVIIRSRRQILDTSEFSAIQNVFKRRLKTEYNYQFDLSCTHEFHLGIIDQFIHFFKFFEEQGLKLSIIAEKPVLDAFKEKMEKTSRFELIEVRGSLSSEKEASL